MSCGSLNVINFDCQNIYVLSGVLTQTPTLEAFCDAWLGSSSLDNRRMPPVRYASLQPTRGLILTFLGGVAIGVGYRQFKSREGASDNADSLNPHTFATYRLVEKRPVAATSSIFTLQRTNGDHSRGRSKEEVTIGDIISNSIWSVQVKQPQLQIARSYTPIPSTEGRSSQSSSHDDLGRNDDDRLRLFIRAEKHGEVSNYIHNLPLSSEVDLRGPFVELPLPGDLREVIFIAGGTGIAPALQVAHVLSQRPGARMHILWNVRHRDECRGGRSDEHDRPPDTSAKPRSLADWDPWSKISRLATFGLGDATVNNNSTPSKPASLVGEEPEQNLIVQELESLKQRFGRKEEEQGGRPGRLTIEYFIDDDNKFIKPKDVSRQLRRVAQEEEEQGAEPEKKLILISGPDGFIELWAGKKVWMGGKEVQGPVGGYFAHFRHALNDWRIWKL